MGTTGLGLLIEEHRGEIASAWRRAVERELGSKDPALAFALAPLLREMSLAFGGPEQRRPSREAWSRCAILVRSTATPAQLAREFKLLHRTMWEMLRAAAVPVGPSDRAAADEWLQDALAEALDRLERVRIRVAALERGPELLPPIARKVRPPPLPQRRPVPPRASATPTPSRSGDEAPIELEPLSMH